MEHDLIIITPDNRIGQRDNSYLISKALGTPGGRAALAAAMAAPIRRNLDYHGIARRALVVDPLPQGALPIYSKDEEDV
jgi:hypothetical protein